VHISKDHNSASSSVRSYHYGTLTEGTGRSVNEEMDQRLNHLKYQIKGNYESYDSSTE